MIVYGCSCHVRKDVVVPADEQRHFGARTTDRYAALIREAFRRYVERLAAEATVQLTEGGKIDPDKIDWKAANRIFSEVWAGAMREVTLTGAAQATDQVEEVARAAFARSFLLDNPYTTAWLKSHGSELITVISDESRAGVHELIRRGVAEHRTVRETARDMRQLIGLRPDQVKAVTRYRERLETDGRSAERVRAMTDRYAKRQLAQRAELIARTETQQGQNEGALGAYREAKDRGFVLPTTRRLWVAGLTPRTCPLCRELHNTKAEIDGVFHDGTRNPPRHPACRCSTSLWTP